MIKRSIKIPEDKEVAELMIESLTLTLKIPRQEVDVGEYFDGMERLVEQYKAERDKKGQ